MSLNVTVSNPRALLSRQRRLRPSSPCPAAVDHATSIAKRICGEVFFARAWLLCEGQSEYLLLRYFAELLGTPLDQTGVTVIDFQNNGSPGAFVGLARAFEIPWILLCDNDSGMAGFVGQVENRGLTDAELNELVRPLPEDGVDWETFLVRHGFSQEFRQILAERSVALTKSEDEPGFEDELVSKVKEDKTGYALALIEKLRGIAADASRVPQFLKTALEDIITKAS